MCATAIERAAEWLATSPRVLIGAGAGLSASAGIDYTDTHSFERLYRGMTRRGFRACYELIGRHDLPATASGNIGPFMSTTCVSRLGWHPSTRHCENSRGGRTSSS